MDNICGIDITGKLAHVLVIKGSKENHEIVTKKPVKIELRDHTNQENIKDFYQNISDFLKENSISKVAIKSGSTGVYKSGPAVFKMEALIQLTGMNIDYVKPQTLSAYWKKCDLDLETLSLKKYQHNAFKVAYFFLNDK